MARYEAKLVENRGKEIAIMKINNENECSRCGQVYHIHVNKAKSCGQGTHQPLH